jgi:hypothetical protein
MPREICSGEPIDKRRVTVNRARDLDRAMLLLQQGKITYGRWVETLDAWTRGEAVGAWDYGDAESVRERVAVQFAGKKVTTREVADHFGVTLTSASHSLGRLAEKGLAERLGHGRWRVGTMLSGSDD